MSDHDALLRGAIEEPGQRRRIVMAAGWTMYFAGLQKHMLEHKQRRRVCPSCGRRIDGRVCNAH